MSARPTGRIRYGPSGIFPRADAHATNLPTLIAKWPVFSSGESASCGAALAETHSSRLFHDVLALNAHAQIGLRPEMAYPGYGTKWQRNFVFRIARRPPTLFFRGKAPLLEFETTTTRTQTPLALRPDVTSSDSVSLSIFPTPQCP
jgi:hypothetical protein